MRINKIYTTILLLLGFVEVSLAQTTPKSVTNTDINWTSVNSYDITGRVVGASVNFFDNLGKATQSQTFDVKTGKHWASEVLYDREGRPALQTFSAPIGVSTDFTYKTGFIKKTNNVNFGISDFEDSNTETPSLLGAQLNTLGWYYSQSNTTEPYQDVTQRPYSRTIFSELNPGEALKIIGGNRINGQWKNGYVFSMPAGRELAQAGAFNDTKYYGENYNIIKTVSRDVHGVENVVFTDAEGKTLATARSGNEEGNTATRISVVRIGEQRYVDVHVPVGTTGITVRDYQGRILNNDARFEVYNLITEQRVNSAFSSFPNGFYRIVVVDGSTTNYTVNYSENYYDYALNEYDNAGRLVASYQPLEKLKSEFQYDALGQLTYTKNPDEGEAWFKYRRDGQIRFSQNSKQKTAGEFSYTNYDDLGRPIESGVLLSTAFGTANPDNTLPSGTKKEQFNTIYDTISTTDNNALPSGYKNPLFLSGNVAKTWNENTTTYYSYDIYGRVAWIVQNISGLGIKTIDYEYDPVSSQVTKVYYQKGQTDQFIHRYTYDAVDYSLTKVETSTNGSTFTEHASYTYYETGALKRTNLAQGLQGIDYVYNLQGALKSINHPSLSGSNDPGGDTNDLFGMIIDYHSYDYNRPKRNIKSASYGVDQYNGNIKGIRWNSSYSPVAGKEHAYSYGYGRDNWLKSANYGYFTGDYSSLPVINEGEAGTAADENITTSAVWNSGTSKNYLANNTIVLKPGFHAKSGSVVSAKISGSSTVHDVNAGNLVMNANGDYKVDNLSYDANGNIQSLNRNKNTVGGSNAMDQLSYVYKTNKPNQLLRVDDAAGDVSGADDIGDQNGNNYLYNEIGQLIQNNQDNISYLYSPRGLVTEVKQGNQPLVKFFYNDKNHRVKKESYNPTNGSLTYTEHYVRDAAGTAMAIYRNGQMIENTIYGSTRLGVRKSDGSHLYQLTDHLGNVRAVVGRTASGQAMALTSATDYYPFGMPMPGRNLQGDYRYAYQGQEKDPETGKEAFELRLWDSRIGRWLTTDPAEQYHSPYMAMGNNPITGVDPDGAKNIRFDKKGNYIGIDHDVWWHNLFFGNRGQYADGNGGWTNFTFNDESDIARFRLDPSDEKYLSGINLDFLNGVGYDRVDQAIEIYGGKDFFPDLRKIYNSSGAGAIFDYQKHIPRGVLYLNKNWAGANVVYNPKDAGNFLWGRTMRLLGVPLDWAGAGAEYNAFRYGKSQNGESNYHDPWYKKITFFGDSVHDKRAIRNGWGSVSDHYWNRFQQ
ncbi:RHS repeat domain-containing protein [Aquimarina spongiae]|uniref:RHS repeat-associated core domain-containing protein n=1 Tax=Aquimarina spongiae TaxID=570521 RepID=A0A1M6A7T6_9FLAO|nr:RHS repeat-associated core domain-containing protein [Aquimarina spongiae]SHI32538.1 RHS repeat-associated core domain-containing protein [Aquimarina spongiae]